MAIWFGIEASRTKTGKFWRDRIHIYSLKPYFVYLLDAIAKQVNISQYYFITLFKQSMGVTPHQYIMQQQIERAKQLLHQTTLSITEVAFSCGFANQSHFTRLFRKHTGVTPKAYQDSY
ncbi:helix-turn-helix transcriptional regulator [Calothrix sp. UHCC 0171]|uniref:helix-turn-helix transcriptional regulator n=1 Tax=Calothrix sp. UHCC 0171 TaxID=3110245 RepID=UPI002B2049F7|nr:helix-turn-helix transcriptional regulator [Calothrix sp. UHCC 0171]MEA5573413.1 helix-turn-helix transcriptional regulator [Calothrix sp. UHCC 0171]